MDRLSQIKNDFHSKKILIFGLGLQGGGVQLIKFFAKLGNSIRVSDLKTKEQLEPSLKELRTFGNIEFILGEHRNEDVEWSDVVIPNPGMRPDSPFLQYAEQCNKEIHLEIGIFIKYCPAYTIGITGTRGKSTTTHLIHHILKENMNKRVFLAGNIPHQTAISLLKNLDEEDIVVLELSSWQLHGLVYEKKSPRIAVFTNMYPDHLNYYPSMREYTEDKMLIFAYQHASDHAVITEDVKNNTHILSAIKSIVHTVLADESRLPRFSNLVGRHNQLNVAVALEVSRVMGISHEKAMSTLHSFRPLPFRLELVGKVKGVTIYNDSTSTTPIACQTALYAVHSEYPQARILLIFGGNEKKLPYDELMNSINTLVYKVFLLKGSFTDIVLPLLSVSYAGPYEMLNNLVKDVLAEAKSGDVVLFSPSATSFASFKNEFDRGTQFTELIHHATKN